MPSPPASFRSPPHDLNLVQFISFSITACDNAIRNISGSYNRTVRASKPSFRPGLVDCDWRSEGIACALQCSLLDVCDIIVSLDLASVVLEKHEGHFLVIINIIWGFSMQHVLGCIIHGCCHSCQIGAPIAFTLVF